MANSQTGRKQHVSLQGKAVDMDLLRQKNELVPAVGNVRVNARGDELGPGGKIIKKREEVMGDYYRDHPQAVPNEEAGVGVADMEMESTVVPKKVSKPKKEPKVEAKVEAKVEVSKDADWREDDDGNFVKKGD
jgi:hypothetical protein|tara:strand:- start:38256 stop:38654 length:399 start_codon:yes stop_codon:yes gene_type:complete